MGSEGTDKVAPPHATGKDPEAERTAQIAIENQIGARKSSLMTHELGSLIMPGLTIDGIMAPDMVYPYPQQSVESNQISDCSKETCVVNGTSYASSIDIPGNRPKPLLHSDGTAVLGPDGKPIVGPDGIDLEKIAANLKAHHNWFSLYKTLYKFRHGGEWDFQRRMTDDVPGQGARAIFTKEYQNFANIAVGYILGALGASLKDIGYYADKYCGVRGCHYNEPKAKDYPNIAERQYKDYEIGLQLWNEKQTRMADSGVSNSRHS
jgi:hypothetical protein